MQFSDFYDIDTEPVVSLQAFYGDPQKLVDKCLILFSIQIRDWLLSHYPCEKIAELTACNGNTPIYCLTHKGEKIAFYLSGLGSAMASSMCCESHWLIGAKHYIMFGSCGSLDGDITSGKFIVPTHSYRGEGTSHYYAPASDYIAIRNSHRVAGFLSALGAPFVEGRVWTTDAMLRETKGLIAKRRSEGCIAVEMELAGVQAACDYFGLELYDFLEAGDVLSDSGYEVEGLHGANHNFGKALLGLEIAAMIS